MRLFLKTRYFLLTKLDTQIDRNLSGQKFLLTASWKKSHQSSVSVNLSFSYYTLTHNWGDEHSFIQEVRGERSQIVTVGSANDVRG
ncbi:hypothetical protein NPIL_271761 [Nephila pilipes]|uniref:Uncharacterized protein n=1 Tax=Nephila pilipes TaxID=299642 RepID=A0A8X6NSI5_NEPPI|nr:hypothetical protein NPIL_271761 [Nephila pilipes]